MIEPTDRREAFRTSIAGFIEARREAKLKDNNDDADAASKYDYATWLADAARRVGQIQAVTHVLKAAHPDARGSSLHAAPSSLPRHAEIGTHSLGEAYVEDVVGNAAALDVFKLLKLEVDGRRLLEWMQAGDADLQSALSGDGQQAQEWMQAFASLVREDAAPATHPMGKQLYWLVGENPHDDANYHLLQPLFASSLAHAVHAEIQDARFGETNKELRQARRESRPVDGSYRDYSNLAVRKLGGTKPQNISQLNSERGGVNYLLASLPPAAWKPRDGTDLLQLDSVFNEKRGPFFWFGEVRRLVRDLVDFLDTDLEANKDTRDRVNALAGQLGEQLALFGAAVRDRRQPGWTRDEDCRLPDVEQLWLDPERSELPPRSDPDHPHRQEQDLAFTAAYTRGDWADEVATRFARWLNQQLRGRSEKLIALGEAEVHYLARKAILDVAWPVPLRRRATEITA